MFIFSSAAFAGDNDLDGIDKNNGTGGGNGYMEGKVGERIGSGGGIGVKAHTISFGGDGAEPRKQN